MNRNAKIRVRELNDATVRTETANRDKDSMNFSMVTNERTNSTTLYVDSPDGDSLELTGQEARTLFLLLNKHYLYTNKI